MITFICDNCGKSGRAAMDKHQGIFNEDFQVMKQSDRAHEWCDECYRAVGHARKVAADLLDEQKPNA